MLEFALQAASNGGLSHFGYIFTAYVAGTHTGQFREDQLEVGQGFRNSYELSKFEAELLVRVTPLTDWRRSNSDVARPRSFRRRPTDASCIPCYRVTGPSVAAARSPAPRSSFPTSR